MKEATAHTKYTGEEYRIVYDLEGVAPFNVTGWIAGPPGTPWEGGAFQVNIKCSEKYPLSPPDVTFSSDMFHPNIYVSGEICVDFLQDKWSPVMRINTVLESLLVLLQDPNCSSPANGTAASMYRKDSAGFKSRVQETVFLSSIEDFNRDHGGSLRPFKSTPT